MTNEEIESRLKVLEPKIQKWKWIVGIATSGAIIVAGVILMGLSLILGHNYTLFAFGIIMDVLGIIYLVINVNFLNKVKKYREEYDSLIKQIESNNCL